jgi:hypothetical protein
MKASPLITPDGQLVAVSDVHFNQRLNAPQVYGVIQFKQTSDTVRGLIRDISERSRSEGKPLDAYMHLSGRSGHSRIGIDVQFGEGLASISDSQKTLEIPVIVTALNRLLAESLADLKNLIATTSVDIGRLFLPLGDALSREQILEAMGRNWLLLPERHEIAIDGVVELPLDNIRYILSQRLLGVTHNFAEMITKGKHGLSLFQNASPAGLKPEVLAKEFLVSAIRISLGPYTGFIERELNNPDVFHLASRLLDGIKTTGMSIPRQVELYNQGETPAATDQLKVRLKLYDGDERVTALAARILLPARAGRVLERGVDFPELTDIFNPKVCASLFDEITYTAELGGFYGRILMSDKMINIPWEQEDNFWLPEFQWRLIYEYARGNLREGVLKGDEIPKRFLAFLDDLKYVGGEQKLGKVFIADCLPPTDTLRVLKRNGIGVIVVRSITARAEKDGFKQNISLDQASYEELFRLEREGVRFYLVFEDHEGRHVREFYKGFWVTEQGKERIDRIQTTIAIFGSSADSLKELLRADFTLFLEGLYKNLHFKDRFAIAHGSGPGVMKVVDEVAASLGVFRFGVGIEAEKLGQISNHGPDALVQFVNLALNTRQDILDRRSIFKIFTAAAGLQEGLVTADEMIDCGGGFVEVSGIRINDHGVFHQLAFRDVIARSSDVGVVRVAQRLGRDQLDLQVRRQAKGLRLLLRLQRRRCGDGELPRQVRLLLARVGQALADGRAEIARRFEAGAGGAATVEATSYLMDQILRLIGDFAAERTARVLAREVA